MFTASLKDLSPFWEDTHPENFSPTPPKITSSRISPSLSKNTNPLERLAYEDFSYLLEVQVKHTSWVFPIRYAWCPVEKNYRLSFPFARCSSYSGDSPPWTRSLSGNSYLRLIGLIIHGFGYDLRVFRQSGERDICWSSKTEGANAYKGDESCA